MKLIDKPLPKSIMDPRIQDNVFYVVESGKTFNVIVNGSDIDSFFGFGYIGWGVKALSNIKKREDANNLCDFLNRLYIFGQQNKQKEIQKSLGLPSKEEIEDMIKEKIGDLQESSDSFDYKLKLSNKLDEIIDTKISEHTRAYEHKFYDSDY